MRRALDHIRRRLSNEAEDGCRKGGGGGCLQGWDRARRYIWTGRRRAGDESQSRALMSVRQDTAAGAISSHRRVPSHWGLCCWSTQGFFLRCLVKILKLAKNLHATQPTLTPNQAITGFEITHSFEENVHRALEHVYQSYWISVVFSSC